MRQEQQSSSLAAVLAGPDSAIPGSAIEDAAAPAPRASHWPRWQTLMAVLSLAVFANVYLHLPEGATLAASPLPLSAAAAAPAPALAASTTQTLPAGASPLAPATAEPAARRAAEPAPAYLIDRTRPTAFAPAAHAATEIAVIVPMVNETSPIH